MTAAVTLRRQPAADLLRSLPAGAIGVLLTDPPYDTVERGSGHLRRWFAGSMSWPQIGRILALARRRMAPDGVAIVLTNSAGLAGAQAALRAAGFERQRLVAWDKRAPGLGGGLRHQVEYAVIGLLPGSRGLTGRDLVSVAAVGPATKGRYPTQKPIELGRQLATIANVRRGELVVDPFCGSGSLLAGAAQRGARVLGGDISARAVALARQRLTAPSVAKMPAAARGRPSLESPPSKARGAYRNSARPTRRTSGKPHRHTRRRQ
jgi:site-specific DNA-methyltransferase (adenine-specific)